MDDSPDRLQQQQEQQTIQRAAAPCACAAQSRRRFNFRGLVRERLDAQITKRYAIEGDLGEGGFGKVYVAEDREIKGRKVAIKKFEITNRKMSSSFEQEVNIMTELDHPNICKILGTYKSGQTYWVVMEYCSGGDVFQQIENGGMQEHEVASIIRQVALALKYSHSMGIAHRDLKPENVCFCDREKRDYVKVIDWGVGCLFSCSNMSSAVGSTLYAAPEVLRANRRDEYGPACDLWSLGVMAYVMISGKPPFWGALHEQLARMNKEKYPMSDRTWQATSAEAKDFIRRLLKADPSARLSMDEVLAHPWFSAACSSSATDGVMEKMLLDNLRRFRKYSQIDAIAALQVATQLDHQSLADIRRVFCDIDSDCDGRLDRQEVKTAFEKRYGAGSREAQDVEDVFDLLDVDRSGKIDYTEFCAAAFFPSDNPSHDAIPAAFQDCADNGRITRDELQRKLRSAAPDDWEQLTEEIFTKYDSDKNGYIDYSEFRRWMFESKRQRSELSERFGGIVGVVDNIDAAHMPSAPNVVKSAGAWGRPRLVHSKTAGPTLLGRSRIGTWLHEHGRSKLSKMSDVFSTKKRPPASGVADGSGGGAAAVAAPVTIVAV